MNTEIVLQPLITEDSLEITDYFYLTHDEVLDVLSENPDWRLISKDVLSKIKYDYDRYFWIDISVAPSCAVAYIYNPFSNKTLTASKSSELLAIFVRGT
jgi:propanediol utilization protein